MCPTGLSGFAAGCEASGAAGQADPGRATMLTKAGSGSSTRLGSASVPEKERHCFLSWDELGTASSLLWAGSLFAAAALASAEQGVFLTSAALFTGPVDSKAYSEVPFSFEDSNFSSASWRAAERCPGPRCCSG